MRSSLRVAMIIQAYHPHVGGAERQLAALAPLLADRGVEAHILTRRYPGLKGFEMVAGMPVHRLPIPGSKVTASLSFTLAALPLLRRLRPDVIHAHELLSPATTAVVAKRLFGIPVVAKVLRGGELGDIAKLKSRRSGARRLTAFRRHVDAFITISREIDNELAEMGIPPQKRPFIPNGVNVDRFKPVSQAKKQGLRDQLGLPAGPIAIFTGRLAAEKRVDQLIDRWTAVRAAHPAAALLILGTGEQEPLLRKRAGDGVHFLGRVEDVVPYLQAADLFVLPSATEGLSNALLEAMAVGLTAVATNVGGAPDVIAHGRNGWLIAPDQPEALQAALVSLLGDAARRTQMGELARAKVARQYALAAVAENLHGLYEAVAAKRPFLANKWQGGTA